MEGGVFEDGFGPGIERTRGGPQMAARRHTVYPATKSGDIGEKERQFLANLDRCVSYVYIYLLDAKSAATAS